MPEKLPHIIFVCSRLDLPGGIERAIVNTANLLDGNGYSVTLLILDVTSDSFYPLAPGLRLIHVPLHFGITEKGTIASRKFYFLQHIFRLKRLLLSLQADVIIGTEYTFSIAAHLAARGMQVRVFAWEHHHFYWQKKSVFWRALSRYVYPKLAAVICLNPDEAQAFQSANCRTTVIPNFVERAAGKGFPDKTILSVGWLIRRKGVDLIPAIAQKIFAVHPHWKWNIIGSGEEEKALKAAIKKLHLEDFVFIIPPQSSDLSAAYSNAGIFVLPSRFECFPMVLLEALSYGVPCVAFDCPTGPAFIINDGLDGELVEPANVEAMAAAIINLISDGEKRIAFCEAAYKNILRFSPEKILELWKVVFQEPLSGRNFREK